jgi:hypothetical protein
VELEQQRDKIYAARHPPFIYRCSLPLHPFPDHIREAATRATIAKAYNKDEDGFWIDFKANWSLVLRVTGP